MSQGGGNTKAYLQGLDGGGTFTFQYNPTQFQVDKQVTWEESKEQGKSKNSLQYQRAAPMTASFECTFDTTNTGANVQKEWVESLLSLTNAVATPSGGEAAELGKKRAPKCRFVFGTFEMICVIESVQSTYTMFGEDGAALRAKCQVKLKEWKDPGESDTTFVMGGMSAGVTNGKLTLASGSSGSAELVTSTGGQTASQIAASAGMDTRDFMELNGIQDGTDIPAGVTYVVTRA
ncbi:MAG: hypothetical protein ACOZNI_02790 [Myxococcota bacterium]